MANKKEELLSLWSNLFVAHPLAIKKVESQMKNKSILGLDEYDLLLIISREKDKKCRFNLLAKKSLYTKSGISRVSKRLLDKGYIAKEGCPQDKRGFYAILTPSGINAIKQSWDIYSKAIISCLDPCLDLQEAIQLKKLLSKLVDKLEEEILIPMPKVRK